MPLITTAPRLFAPLFLALAVLTIALSASPRVPPTRPPVERGEVRGLWVTRTWMTSPQKVAQVVDDAARHGMSAIFVQVRGRGDAYYAGGPDPRAVLLATQPMTFDPLADLVQRAHARGLQVHAWVNLNLIAGFTDLPKSPAHIVKRHPEWLMVPRELAPALLAMPPSAAGYVARLAQWSRANGQRIEGLFSSPIPEPAQEHAVEVMRHLTRQYALDGIHLDYVRYPGPDFDYSRAALEAFRASILLDLTPAEIARFDARARTEPFIYTDMFPQRWTAYRRARLTTLVTRVRAVVRAERPAAMLTTAVWPEVEDALDRKMQDWPTWLRTGIIDAVCPMMYTASPTVFSRQLIALAAQPAGTVWPGIGVYRITSGEAARRVEEARRAGFSGVMLFSYDSMSGGVGRDSPYLAALHRDVFRRASPSGAAASSH